MPEAACLHIQARESDPVRVVELPGVSVRIGRASYCEVRLAEPQIPEEVCRLRRRGATWHLVPVATPSGVSIDGRAVERPRPLPFGVPLRVGEHWLTLRPGSASPPVWGTYESPIPVEVHSAPLTASTSIRAETVSSPNARGREEPSSSRLGEGADGDRLTRWKNRRGGRTGRAAGGEAEPSWEVRWRALGERLRKKPAAPSVTTAAPTRPAGWDSIELPQHEPAPVRPATPPRVPAPPIDLKSTLSEPRAEPFPTPKAGPPPIRPAEEPLSRPEAVASTSAVSGDRSAESCKIPVEQTESAKSSPPTSSVESDTVLDPSSEASLAFHSVFTPFERSQRIEQVSTSEPGATWVGSAPFVTNTGLTPGRAEDDPEPVSSQASAGSVSEREEDPRPARKSVEIREERLKPASDRAKKATPKPKSPPSGDVAPAARDGGPAPTTGRPADQAVTAGPEWPSVRDILAAHGARPRPQSEAPPVERPARPADTGPLLTVVQAPRQWKLPLWLGWFPLMIAAIVAGAAGISASWTWSQEARLAGLAANALQATDTAAAKPFDPDALPGTKWWQSTSGNLTRIALALGRGSDDESKERARSLLESAATLSPLDASARYAVSHLERNEEGPLPLASRLGLSRDVLSLAWSGHLLLKANRKDAALRAYREALEMASRFDSSHVPVPRFIDDAQVRRFALPVEELIGLVVRDMVSHTEWSYAEWSAALPHTAVVPLVVARLLRENSRADSNSALDAVIASESPATAGDPEAAMALAAQAEAYALRSDWSNAQARYGEAIERMSNDLIRRSWWFNLADIELRLNDESRRQQALEAARSSDPRDPVTRRALDLLKDSGFRPERSSRSKATPKRSKP